MKIKHLSLIIALILPFVCNAQDKVIRVLGIGNSFSEDSIEQNLHLLAQADGTPMVIANLYIAGCSIDTHCRMIKENTPAYRYTKFDEEGNKTITDHVAIASVIGEEEWDYISVQQVSGLSGVASSYAKLEELVNWVHKNAPKAKIVFHQTWAYAVGSNHNEFPRYDRSQVKMYAAICETVKKECPKVGIKQIIPTGTAIQIARQNTKDYDMTRDGYHLSLGMGRYIAACTWYQAITGKKVVGNKYYPDGSDPRTQAITKKQAKKAQKAAAKACKQWKAR